MIPKLVSIQQACAILGVSRRTIYNYLKSGKLKCERTPGGSVRIPEDSLTKADTKWLEQ